MRNGTGTHVEDADAIELRRPGDAANLRDLAAHGHSRQQPVELLRDRVTVEDPDDERAVGRDFGRPLHERSEAEQEGGFHGVSREYRRVQHSGDEQTTCTEKCPNYRSARDCQPN